MIPAAIFGTIAITSLIAFGSSLVKSMRDEARDKKTHPSNMKDN